VSYRASTRLHGGTPVLCSYSRSFDNAACRSRACSLGSEVSQIFHYTISAHGAKSPAMKTKSTAAAKIANRNQTWGFHKKQPAPT